MLFPYALVNIAFLANLVGEIASWLSDRRATQRAEWRIRTEAQARRHADDVSNSARRTLGEEIAFLKQVARSQAQYELLSQLGVSIVMILACAAPRAATVLIARLDAGHHGLRSAAE